MKTLKRFALLPALLVALLACAAVATAENDPPSRAARLKYMSGEVSIQPGGVDDWVAAVLNRPLTTADRVWTDKDSRAELQMGSAALRLNSETSLTLTNVSDDIVQLELDQGTLNLHIRHLFDGETYEVDTPNMAFTVLKAGDYRFDVDPGADTSYVTAWHGEGEANGQERGVRVKSGRQASFSKGTSLEYHINDAPGSDGFDDWCRVRDDREDHAESYRYVSADVIGADDLDEYGTWRVVGAYGPVWVPAVAPGWAPYHYGHWVWVEPWGWTWVDDAPWGFAPCHYGRWVHTGGFWAWAPGPGVVARPVYAPALVAWVGGPHFGVSVSFGGGVGVGWFPLGWGEPYVPAYAVSRTYFQNVNVTNTHITNITTVTNNYYIANNNTTTVQNNISRIHYANQNVAGAVTAVPQRVMVNSESVARAAVVIPAHEVQAGTVAMAAPVAPARNSVLGANAGARAAAPRALVGRPVVSHMAPPPRPLPFEAKQGELARNPGRPLDSQTESQIRAHIGRTQAPNPSGVPAQSGRPASPPMPQPRPANIPATATAPVTPPRTVPRPPQPGMTSQPTVPMNAERTTPSNVEHNTPRPPESGPSREAAPVDVQRTMPDPASSAHPVNAGPSDPPQHNVPRPQPGRTNMDAGQPGSQPPQFHPQSQPAPRPQYQPQPQPQAEPHPQVKPAPEAPRREAPRNEEVKPEHSEPRTSTSQPSHGAQKTDSHSQHTGRAKEVKKSS